MTTRRSATATSNTRTPRPRTFTVRVPGWWSAACLEATGETLGVLLIRLEEAAKEGVGKALASRDDAPRVPALESIPDDWEAVHVPARLLPSTATARRAGYASALEALRTGIAVFLQGQGIHTRHERLRKHVGRYALIGADGRAVRYVWAPLGVDLRGHLRRDRQVGIYDAVPCRFGEEAAPVTIPPTARPWVERAPRVAVAVVRAPRASKGRGR